MVIVMCTLYIFMIYQLFLINKAKEKIVFLISRVTYTTAEQIESQLKQVQFILKNSNWRKTDFMKIYYGDDEKKESVKK